MVIEKDLKTRILELHNSDILVRIPASEQEYLKLAYEVPFKIEYHDSEIIVMSLASYIHEKIVTNLISFLSNLFDDETNIDILGGGLGVKTEKFEGSYFLPDVTLVKGNPDFEENSTAIINNPTVIFEILSPSTKSYDLSEKLEEYKTFESLEQVVFVYQDKMKVATYQRSYKPVGWLNQDFYSETDFITVNGKQVPLKNIYRKIELDK